MKIFRKVAIIGTGLIGGSLGLEIKKRKLAREVVGVSRHKQSIALAKKIGAIDKGSLSLEIARGADFLILATPVEVILDLAPRLAKIIAKDCLVTDVGSTKKEIAFKLGKIFPQYIGSHPLAGSEKRSIIHAREGIFQGTLCILTPSGSSDPKALAKLKLFWQRLGVTIKIMSCAKHDRILSFVSHLPHAAAFSLIDMIPQRYLDFASGGLKDTTRIAASDAILWMDIFLTNRQNLLKRLSQLQDKLNQIKSALRNKDKKQLVAILKRAGRKRAKLG